MSSFFAQVMQPGGGVMLIPLVRVVIGFLLVLTLAGFMAGVARVHMAVLSFLSAGLLVSLSMFEKEFNKVESARRGASSAMTTTTKPDGKVAKTD